MMIADPTAFAALAHRTFQGCAVHHIEIKPSATELLTPVAWPAQRWWAPGCSISSRRR